MRQDRELIPLESGQSFRSFHWNDSVKTIYIHGESGAVRPQTGLGDRWHFHIESELTLFTKGFGTRFVGDSIAPFDSGDLVLLGSNLPHYWNCSDTSAGVSVQFSTVSGSALRQIPELGAIQVILQHQALRGIRFIGETREEINAIMLRFCEMSKLERFASLMTIIDRIAKAPRSDYVLLSQKAFNLQYTASSKVKIQQIIEYVMEHHDEDLTLEMIASKFALSKATLCRHIKKYTGKSLKQLVKEIKLDNVRMRLTDSEDNISTIAFDCGFNNLSNFNEQFRKVYGKTPIQYRAELNAK